MGLLKEVNRLGRELEAALCARAELSRTIESQDRRIAELERQRGHQQAAIDDIIDRIALARKRIQKGKDKT